MGAFAQFYATSRDKPKLVTCDHCSTTHLRGSKCPTCEPTIHPIMGVGFAEAMTKDLPLEDLPAALLNQK